jgi:hypothetical protein
MQDYSYIYVSGMVLSNPGITPHSNNLKQLRNAPRVIFRKAYTYKKQKTTLFLHPVLFVLLL